MRRSAWTRCGPSLQCWWQRSRGERHAVYKTNTLKCDLQTAGTCLQKGRHLESLERFNRRCHAALVDRSHPREAPAFTNKSARRGQVKHRLSSVVWFLISCMFSPCLVRHTLPIAHHCVQVRPVVQRTRLQLPRPTAPSSLGRASPRSTVPVLP